MNKALFFAMGKIYGRNIFNYALGAVIYEWLIIWVYPSIAKSTAMNSVIQSMPASLQKAFGMQGGIRQLGDYLGAEFYGLIFILVLSAFTIVTAIGLMARMVDRGSMAYFLATPASRQQVAATQAMILMSGIFVICACTTLGGLIGAHIFVPKATLHIDSFAQVNVLGFLLFSVIGGFCFLCSSLINDEKRALGIAAGVTVVEYALHLISTLADSFGWMKYVSVFTTFDAQSVLRGSAHVSLIETLLALFAIALYVMAIRLFKHRDLPL